MLAATLPEDPAMSSSRRLPVWAIALLVPVVLVALVATGALRASSFLLTHCQTARIRRLLALSPSRYAKGLSAGGASSKNEAGLL